MVYEYPTIIRKNIISNNIDSFIERYIGKKRHHIKTNQFVIGRIELLSFNKKSTVKCNIHLL